MKYFLLGTQVLILTTMLGLHMGNVIRNQKVLGAKIEREAQKEQYQKKIAYWEQVVQKDPTYRDSYLNLAILNFYLEDLDQALTWWQQLRRVDPNFDQWQLLPQEFARWAEQLPQPLP